MALVRLPPQYDHLVETGNESLPNYRPALTKSSIAGIKRELSSPFRRSICRSWSTCQLELNNTQLRLTGGRLLKQTRYFSLQYAEVGLAADYGKRDFVLRIRVEARQFLLGFNSQKECLEWLIALQTAIGLALPLELRTIPEEARRRRHRHRSHRSSTSRGDNTNDAEASTPSRTIQGPSLLRQDNTGNSTEYKDDMSETDALRLLESSKEIEVIVRSRSGSRTSMEHNYSSASEESSSGKWQPPRRHHHRHIHRDLPHLPVNLSWEGKSVLYRGRWAVVHRQYIYMVL